MIYNFYEDPGHGYLEVPLPILEASGVKNSISGYSGKNKDFAYLEEDCDAPLFMKSWQDKTGEKVEFKVIYCEHRRVPTHNFWS